MFSMAPVESTLRKLIDQQLGLDVMVLMYHSFSPFLDSITR